MALGTYEAPYVHSNLINLNAQLTGNLDSSSEKYKEEINNQIEELKKIKEVLKTEADAFLDGKTPEEVMKEIRENGAIFQQIGIEVLNSPEILNVLRKTEIKYQNKTLNKIFGEKLPITIANGLVSEKQLIDEISTYIMTEMNFGTKTRSQQIDFLGELFSGLEKGLPPQVLKTYKRALTSKDGKIKKIIKTLLRSGAKKGIGPSLNKSVFYKTFEDKFRQILRSKDIVVDLTQLDDYLNNVKLGFKNIKWTDDYNQRLGTLGEDAFAVVINSETNSSMNITIEVVGNLNEEEIYNNFKGKVQGKMINYRSEDRFSQTDLLMTNKSGKTVRVQSKNLQKAYQAFVEGKNIPGFASLDGDKKYLDLIAQLQVSPMSSLSKSDLNNLSYLLANEVWFRSHKSIGGSGRSKYKAHGISKSGTMSNVAGMVTDIFSKEIKNFLGYAIDESMVVKKPAINANSFFLISNKILLPTYTIIEDLIQQLNKEQTKISRFKVSIKMPGDIGLPKSTTFYKNKADSVGGTLIKNGGYEDANLLREGQNVGQKIIDNLSFNNIGISFDINTLLSSSYVFSKI